MARGTEKRRRKQLAREEARKEAAHTRIHVARTGVGPAGRLVRQVARADLAGSPELVWNAFVDLLSQESYEALSERQRMAYLAFWYDSEVQNGGHGQFFENQGFGRLQGTVNALDALGLPCQARLLAGVVSSLDARGPVGDWTEVVTESLERELDSAFYACHPDVATALERELSSHQDEYVALV